MDIIDDYIKFWETEGLCRVPESLSKSLKLKKENLEFLTKVGMPKYKKLKSFDYDEVSYDFSINR